MTEIEQIECNIRFFIDPFIQQTNKWIYRNIYEFAVPDREEYIHSSEFIDGFKKETVYHNWHSEELMAKIEEKKENARKCIKAAEQEINNFEKLKMLPIEYSKYFREKMQQII